MGQRSVNSRYACFVGSNPSPLTIMKKPYISPWISSTYPSTEDEDYSEVVLTRLEGGIVIPAKWDTTNKIWLFQEIKDYQLTFEPLAEVNVVAWMYIPD